MKIEAVKVTERTSDGGFKQLKPGCFYCGNINNTVIALLIPLNKNIHRTKICKTCLCEAIKEIDKKLLED